MWFSLAVACGAAADPDALRASKPEVRKQIVATIEAQLAAFRKNDLPAAFLYFAPELQAEKPLPLFAAIVRANYPEFLSNTRAEFGIVRDDGVSATVLVHVFAKDSDASYDYTLIKVDGRWLIHGVVRHNPLKEEQV